MPVPHVTILLAHVTKPVAHLTMFVAHLTMLVAHLTMLVAHLTMLLVHFTMFLVHVTMLLVNVGMFLDYMVTFALHALSQDWQKLVAVLAHGGKREVVRHKGVRYLEKLMRGMKEF